MAEVDRNIVGWRGKILSGYLYAIGEEGTMYTGQGGAINFGEALEMREIPDALIQESIKVHLLGGDIPLSQLTVKQKK